LFETCASILDHLHVPDGTSEAERLQAAADIASSVLLYSDVDMPRGRIEAAVATIAALDGAHNAVSFRAALSGVDGLKTALDSRSTGERDA
jgi:hypothetical protein